MPRLYVLAYSIFIYKMRFIISEEINKNIVYHGSAVKFNSFDPKFIGSGHETEVHGYGFYFSLSEKIARYYAKELKSVKKQAYLYTVKLTNNLNIVNWEGVINEYLAQTIYKSIEENYEDVDLEDLQDALGLSADYYGDFPLFSNIYDHLKYDLNGSKEVSKFFYEKCKIDGAIFDSKENFGEVKNLVIFSEDSIINILNIEEL